MEIKKWNKFNLAFGSILLLIAVALLVFWKVPDSRIILPLIALGAVAIINGFLWPKRRFFKFLWIYSDTPEEEDERTRKMGAFATAYAWSITLILIAVLMFLEFFNLLKMNVMEVLLLIFFVMLGTTAGVYAYLRRKGNVE